MKKITIIFSIILSWQLSAATVNFLDVGYYGFEKESSSWWIQHSDAWSISTQKAASGDNALKFSAATAITENKKVHSSDQNYLFSLEPGTYRLSLKFFIPNDYTGSAFSCIIKDTWINTKVDLTNMERDQWITFTKELDINEKVNNSRLLISVATSQAGLGSFYIDDITLTGEMEGETSLTSSIQKENGLFLSSHYYKAKLKVWVDEETDLEAFYTIIDAPYTALKWDISSISRATWVELEQDFMLKENATNAGFKVTVPNSRGAGRFYVDDISFSETDESSIVGKKISGFSVFPNPSCGIVNIKSDTKAYLSIYSLRGKLLIHKGISPGINSVDISPFGCGLCLIRLTHNEGVYQAKLIVE